MRHLPLLLLAACTTTVPGDSDPADSDAAPDPRRDPSTWPDTLGGDRPARVVTPSNYDGSLLPVVVVLHGYGASGAVQDAYFGVSARADSQGLIAILPDGTKDGTGKQFWNATDACCDFGDTAVDDVGYLLGLLDEAEATLPVDPDRLTFVGHSNGGFMAHHLACEAPGRIAGVASLAGATWFDPGLCDAADTTSVLQVHGTFDTTIAYDGGKLLGLYSYPSAEESVGFWADRNGCTTPQGDGAGNYDNAVPGDETTRQAWSGCDADRQVALWTMTGSAHIPAVNDTFKEAVTAWLMSVRR